MPDQLAELDPPDWSTLTFGFHPTPTIYRSFGRCGHQATWDEGALYPASEPLALPAAAAVLSYGYGIFEGIKAHRSIDDQVLLFRPRDHAARLVRSAERLLMLPVPVEHFVEAVSAVVRANARFIPPIGQGAFYLRPTEHAIEPMLGIEAPVEFVFTVYGSPVGELSTFGSDSASLRLKVLPIARAAPGGTGAAKAIGNYPGTLVHKKSVRAEGFDDALFTDARHHRWVQETTGSNVFCLLRSGTLVTPELGDTILAGVTRDSVLELARELGVPTEERPLSVDEIVADGVELFCTGTAWRVRSVTELGVGSSVHALKTIALAQALRERLLQIQIGSAPDRFGWTQRIEAC